MLYYAFLFLFIAIIAGLLGFRGAASVAASISQFFFVLFFALFIILVVLVMAGG